MIFVNVNFNHILSLGYGDLASLFSSFESDHFNFMTEFSLYQWIIVTVRITSFPMEDVYLLRQLDSNGSWPNKTVKIKEAHWLNGIIL